MDDLLNEVGWSQAFFAKRIGVSTRTVNRWVLGKNRGQGYPVAMAYLYMIRSMLSVKYIDNPIEVNDGECKREGESKS